VIHELKPFLSPDDVLMDCGNSLFMDTNIRCEELSKTAIHFMGVGISGGESGARFGPSIMPGGPEQVYQRVAPMLEAIAAKVNHEPCVTWLGPGSAGHYVKMIHNGIEYGLMQLISEAYHLLKVSVGFSNDQLHASFAKWNQGRLHSFLFEITAAIFTQKDTLSHQLLIDKILDSAQQKGTGVWTSESAMNLQVPIPVIDSAVAMRDLSAHKEEREKAADLLKGPGTHFKVEDYDLVTWLEEALYFSMIITYAQGMALLQNASREYQYNLKPEKIARIWRGGCIIRSALLETIAAAFAKDPGLPSLLMDQNIAQQLMETQNGIRKTVQTGSQSGIPVPAMMASLGYFDSFRSRWLPANLIQAQRDYFGAHTYQRNDREGIFHTHWD
jgi:6-phosphogluconate dehydrogenase